MKNAAAAGPVAPDSPTQCFQLEGTLQHSDAGHLGDAMDPRRGCPSVVQAIQYVALTFSELVVMKLNL